MTAPTNQAYAFILASSCCPSQLSQLHLWSNYPGCLWFSTFSMKFSISLLISCLILDIDLLLYVHSEVILNVQPQLQIGSYLFSIFGQHSCVNFCWVKLVSVWFSSLSSGDHQSFFVDSSHQPILWDLGPCGLLLGPRAQLKSVISLSVPELLILVRLATAFRENNRAKSLGSFHWTFRRNKKSHVLRLRWQKDIRIHHDEMTASPVIFS